MVELKVENTERSISTPSNSNFLKKSMSTSIFVYSHIIILYPSTLGTFFFKNSNFTNFYNQYRRIYINYQVDK